MAAIDLSILSAGVIPGVSPAGGAALAEAAAVMLEREGHRNGVALRVAGEWAGEHELRWPAPDTSAGAYWADERRATEAAAEAVAIGLLETLSPWTIVERSRIGTGFDYWAAPKDSRQAGRAILRLEVSGIRSAGAAAVAGRVRVKARQVARAPRSPWPTLIVVVEMGTPLAEAKRTWVS